MKELIVSFLLFFLKQDEEKAFDAVMRVIIEINKKINGVWVYKVGRNGYGYKKQ